MKFLSCIFAVALAIGMVSTSASAATYTGDLGGLEMQSAPASNTLDGHVKVADSFGAGLATGIIGSVIVGSIIKHKRYHGYRHRRYHRSRYHGRCSYWSRRCARNWGYGGSNYRGCLRYHGCY